MMDKDKLERGLDNLHGWINYAIASGVPEAIMWEWLFHTKAQKPEIIGDDITVRVNELIQSGQLTVRQMFDIATEYVSKDSAYDVEESWQEGMIDSVRGYLQRSIQAWERNIK